MIRKYYIRTQEGELHLTDRLDGYPDCEILEENVAVPRSNFCTRVDGRWKIDKEAHRKAARHTKLSSMSNAELVDMIEERLAKAGL